MKLFDVKTDNVTDYKETSLLLVFPYCTGKCGPKCHNYNMIGKKPNLDVSVETIVDMYNNLKTHKAVVFAGLEPMDSFDDVCDLVKALSRISKNCDIVIYTGYYEYEIKDKIKKLIDIYHHNRYGNKELIIKFGRYIDNPEDPGHFSEILGIHLAGNNQTVMSVSHV